MQKFPNEEVSSLNLSSKVIGKHSITGLRTDCFTEKVIEVKLNYYVKLGSLFKLWFYINRRIREGGWMACSGTSKSWDRLFIPASEMERAISDIEEQLQGETGNAEMPK